MLMRMAYFGSFCLKNTVVYHAEASGLEQTNGQGHNHFYDLFQQ